jgi:hypothetical protein
MNSYQREQRKTDIKARLAYRKLRRINNAALRAAGNCPGIPCGDCDCRESCKQIAETMDAYRQECDKKC